LINIRGLSNAVFDLTLEDEEDACVGMAGMPSALVREDVDGKDKHSSAKFAKEIAQRFHEERCKFQASEQPAEFASRLVERACKAVDKGNAQALCKVLLRGAACLAKPRVKHPRKNAGGRPMTEQAIGELRGNAQKQVRTAILICLRALDFEQAGTIRQDVALALEHIRACVGGKPLKDVLSKKQWLKIVELLPPLRNIGEYAPVLADQDEANCLSDLEDELKVKGSREYLGDVTVDDSVSELQLGRLQKGFTDEGFVADSATASEGTARSVGISAEAEVAPQEIAKGSDIVVPWAAGLGVPDCVDHLAPEVERGSRRQHVSKKRPFWWRDIVRAACREHNNTLTSDLLMTFAGKHHPGIFERYPEARVRLLAAMGLMMHHEPGPMHKDSRHAIWRMDPSLTDKFPSRLQKSKRGWHGYVRFVTRGRHVDMKAPLRQTVAEALADVTDNAMLRWKQMVLTEKGILAMRAQGFRVTILRVTKSKKRGRKAEKGTRRRGERIARRKADATKHRKAEKAVRGKAERAVRHKAEKAGGRGPAKRGPAKMWRRWPKNLLRAQ